VIVSYNKSNVNNFYIRNIFVLIGLFFFGYVYEDLIPFNFQGLYLVGFFYCIYIIKKIGFTPIEKNALFFVVLLFFYWLVTVFVAAYHGVWGKETISNLNLTHTVIFFSILLYTIFRLRPGLDFFWNIFFVAGALLTVLFFIELIFALKSMDGSLPRLGSSFSNPIKFGVFANTVLVVLIGAIPWALKKGKTKFIILIFICLSLFFAALLSQTRTAWLGWPEIVLGWGSYYLYVLGSRYKWNAFKKFSAVIFFVLLSVSIYSFTFLGSVVENRIDKTALNLENYFSGEDFDTSLGHRLLMYEASIKKIKDNFWFGIGHDQFPEFLKTSTSNLAKEKFDQDFSGLTYSTAHNQFLMTWLTKGFFGFFSISLIIIFLLMYFFVGLKKSRPEYKTIWLASFLFTVSCLLYFLPASPLQKSATSTHIFLILAILVSFTSLAVENSHSALKKK
jgi:O-antigen ligase